MLLKSICTLVTKTPTRQLPRVIACLNVATKPQLNQYAHSQPRNHMCMLTQYQIHEHLAKTCISRSWARWRHHDSPDVELREHLTVDGDELSDAIKNDEVYVVDVRGPEECAEGRISTKRWVNVPVQELESALKLSDKAFQASYGSPKPQPDADDVVFHCRAGVRSTKALNIAQSLGYTKTRHYPPGWLGWEEHLSKGE